MNPLQRFAQASNRYLPDSVRLLFIAEAPPDIRVHRFFYFTGLTKGDTLFLEMMKVLYPRRSASPERDSSRVSRYNRCGTTRRTFSAASRWTDTS